MVFPVAVIYYKCVYFPKHLFRVFDYIGYHGFLPDISGKFFSICPGVEEFNSRKFFINIK